MRRRRKHTSVQKVAGKFDSRRRAARPGLRHVSAICHPAQGAGEPEAAMPSARTAERRRPGSEAGKAGACKASVARVPPAAPQRADVVKLRARLH